MGRGNPAFAPTGFELFVYDERWGYIKDRINLLLKNGPPAFLSSDTLFISERTAASWVTSVYQLLSWRHWVRFMFTVGQST
ncbi:MAG: hypothetical protein CM1200mP18_10820 [Gammaproteobacteria bacterium]|nr:MAG: hypothetical protein CM1200mP18_10820 [Gammaproteobacteria bacterium]